MATTTRETIVEAARRVFYEKGFDHTSLGDLAREAGVPKGNFYYHFKTKDEVLAAVVEARTEEMRDMLAQWREEMDAKARVRRVVKMLTRDGRQLVRFGCPIGSLLVELGKDHVELKKLAAAQLELLAQFVAEQFVEQGRSRAEARRLALHLLGRCQGIVLLAQAYGSPRLLASEVLELEGWLDQVL